MSVVGRLFFADGGKSDWEALSTIVKMVWEWGKSGPQIGLATLGYGLGSVFAEWRFEKVKILRWW